MDGFERMTPLFDGFGCGLKQQCYCCSNHQDLREGRDESLALSAPARRSDFAASGRNRLRTGSVGTSERRSRIGTNPEARNSQRVLRKK
jgi:hypothetical protein